MPMTSRPNEDAEHETHEPTYCRCGAFAVSGLCGKCRARLVWQRREAGRARHARRSDRSRAADRRRPRGRRPGR